MIIEVSKERALQLIEKAAVFFASRRMGAPAIMFLESFRPLHNVGSQIMYLLSPFANIIFTAGEFEEFAALIADHDNVQLLIKRLDELDEQYNKEQRELERLRRKKWWAKVKGMFKRKTDGKE